MNLYVIYDRLAESSSAPFVAKNDAVAARQVAVFFANNPTVSFDEIELRWLGEFNGDTGCITLGEHGRSIAYGQYLRRMAQLSTTSEDVNG